MKEILSFGPEVGVVTGLLVGGSVGYLYVDRWIKSHLDNLRKPGSNTDPEHLKAKEADFRRPYHRWTGAGIGIGVGSTIGRCAGEILLRMLQ